MKKILLGSTALIAAAAFTAPAMSAERLQLQLRGYHVGGIAYTDVSGNSDDNEINFGSDSEVHFRGATTLDNGLEVSFRAELELEDDGAVDGDPDNIDEVYVQIDGGFGRLQFGQNDGVMDQMAVVAPLIFKEHGHSDADLDPFDPYGFDNDIDTVGDHTGDDIKLIYFTPSMNGFQLGFSYTPNPCKNDTGYSGCVDDEDSRNFWEVAGTFEHDFNNVSFEVSGGYGQGEQGGLADNPTEWTVGANIGFGGVTFGGSYKDSEVGSSNDGETWDAGISYEAGPWAFNVAYGNLERDSGSEEESWIGGLTYTYGPGMQIGIGVNTLDDTASNGEGTAVFVENAISF